MDITEDNKYNDDIDLVLLDIDDKGEPFETQNKIAVKHIFNAYNTIDIVENNCNVVNSESLNTQIDIPKDIQVDVFKDIHNDTIIDISKNIQNDTQTDTQQDTQQDTQRDINKVIEKNNDEEINTDTNKECLIFNCINYICCIYEDLIDCIYLLFK